MPTIDLVSILAILQIALQLVAAYFAYNIFRYNRSSKAWLAVVVALILMALRRVTALLIQFGVATQLPGPIAVIDRIWLPFFISVFLLWGLYTMSKNFETFDVVSKKVTEKLKNNGKKKKK